jgi:ribosomal protein S18 acetylase RimI-like enzyme
VHIRLARVEDSAGLAHVQVDSYRTAYAGIMPQDYLDHFTYEEQEQDWRDLLSAEMDDVLLVAETGAGEIVGYALGRAKGDIAPYDSELVALHVRCPHQRQGIGRQLVAAMARSLQQRGCASLMLWVLQENRARGFYERLGGQLLDESKQSGAGPLEVAYGWPAIERLYTGE